MSPSCLATSQSSRGDILELPRYSRAPWVGLVFFEKKRVLTVRKGAGHGFVLHCHIQGPQ